MNSRTKGKRGELELSKKLKEFGYECRRGQQFCGLNGDADVVGLPGIHIECKRVEKLNITDAIDQARRDAKPSEIPAVFHRKNYCDWLVTMRLEDWMAFVDLSINMVFLAAARQITLILHSFLLSGEKALPIVIRLQRNR